MLQSAQPELPNRRSSWFTSAAARHVDMEVCSGAVGARMSDRTENSGSPGSSTATRGRATGCRGRQGLLESWLAVRLQNAVHVQGRGMSPRKQAMRWRVSRAAWALVAGLLRTKQNPPQPPAPRSSGGRQPRWVSHCFTSFAAVQQGAHAIPSTWHSPIPSGSGATVLRCRRADEANLAPAAGGDNLCGG